MAAPRGSLRHHTILPTDAVGVDSVARRTLRVFCDVRQHSVALDVCQACPSCVEIAEGKQERLGCVSCSPAPETLPAASPPSGAVLHRGVVAVDEGVLVRDIVALFVERGVRMIVVTDASGRVGGVVHESQLIREIRGLAHLRPGEMRLEWDASEVDAASAIMFPAATILESAPLRAAVVSMANLHQRQLLVVDEQGLPIGVLVDVDALHALHMQEHASEGSSEPRGGSGSESMS